ncbi:MAG: hypothetical protein DHS20C15_11310 [Planctomycetota bacterium]|nr:MAG: hypothetical protein DHS20C15_11310 [Planctomycetota bacterium]
MSLTACAGGEARRYYAPVELNFAGANKAWEAEFEGTTFRLRCQGAYLNEVAGRTQRTVHMQLEVTRSRDGDLRLRQSDLKLDVGDHAAQRVRELRPAEVWHGRNQLAGSLEVRAWSRRAFDLFFDEDPEQAFEPAFLRLRWRWTTLGEEDYADCSFRRLADDNPALPAKLSSAQLKFGVADGFYLPGYGELGRRALRPSEEERQHYLFHAPGGWFW